MLPRGLPLAQPSSLLMQLQPVSPEVQASTETWVSTAEACVQVSTAKEPAVGVEGMPSWRTSFGNQGSAKSAPKVPAQRVAHWLAMEVWGAVLRV